MNTLIVLGIIFVGMWLIYSYVPSPVKWVLEAILGILVVIICFHLAGIPLPR